MEITAINSSDKHFTSNRYILAFGAYGWTQLMVWANNLEDALDECVDWIAENAPGLLCDDEVAELYKEAIAEGKSEEEAREESEMDTTVAGNCGHYLHSWEWNIVAENPTRQEIKQMLAA
jgi:hypothetical protein